jgi:uncharacterized membrane protein YccC
MTFDLREGEAGTPDAEADERPAAERRVAWYFGDLLDRVASEYPVARHHLVAVLAELDALARTYDLTDRDRTEPVRHPHAPGRVLRLPLQLWTLLEEMGDLSEEELRAARAVHRRMGEALVDADAESDPSAPLFVLAAEPPHGD